MKKLLFALLVLMMTSAQGQFIVPKFYPPITSHFSENFIPGLVFVTELGSDTLGLDLCIGLGIEDSATVENRIKVLAQAMKEVKKMVKQQYAVVSDTSFCTLYFCVQMPMLAERVLGNLSLAYSQDEYAYQLKRWTQTSKRLKQVIPALLAGKLDLGDQLAPATQEQLESLVIAGYPAVLVYVLRGDIRFDLDLRAALDRKVERLCKK